MVHPSTVGGDGERRRFFRVVRRVAAAVRLGVSPLARSHNRTRLSVPAETSRRPSGVAFSAVTRPTCARVRVGCGRTATRVSEPSPPPRPEPGSSSNPAPHLAAAGAAAGRVRAVPGRPPAVRPGGARSAAVAAASTPNGGVREEVVRDGVHATPHRGGRADPRLRIGPRRNVVACRPARRFWLGGVARVGRVEDRERARAAPARPLLCSPSPPPVARIVRLPRVHGADWHRAAMARDVQGAAAAPGGCETHARVASCRTRRSAWEVATGDAPTA